MHDPVSNPSHYTAGGIECIEAQESSMSAEAFRGALKFNCQKYLWRYEGKNGLEDLRKARWYLDRLIASMETMEHAAEEVAECVGGFCPMPAVRLGPSESMFPPVN
jgi:formate-dependent nitrite reductase cytochrome c552 subunit